ncbi:MAG: leucine-rich repeat domain-containing protein [Bacteroidales bacterium]|nr:leucine-rich repeat domain-containing protein [Bacteroidales bacterium]
MKRLALFICTLLCANVLLAQTEFIVGNLKYKVNASNQQEVGVYAADTTIITANIPETVTYQGTTYNVTYIGYRAFRSCSSLTSVTIPNSVTSIGNHAFENCSSLTSVTIPNSVTYIGDAAFYNCNSLTSITIPNSVTSIGSEDFHAVGAFQNCSSLTSITIPNSVTYIGNKTFFGCSSLITITIPNSVTSIGRAVFYGCSSLTSVSLGTGITSLMYYNSNGKSPTYGFFHDCSSLTSVIFEDNSNLTKIGYWTFYNCSSLTSITIPNSVTYIGSGAFENCSSLTSVTIPNSVTSIGEATFYGCNNLTSMTVEMNNIPNLSNIGLNSTLQNLTLEENVTSIASGAFNNYSFLQNVTCLATTPPTLEDNTVFPYPNIASLKVPCGTLEAYSAPTSFWNMFFAGRISEDCSGLEDAEFAELSVYPNPTSGKVTFSKEIEKIEVIDLSGKILQTYENANEINIEALPAGVYHLRLTIEDKTTTRKVITE